jgi:hypothetical protein
VRFDRNRRRESGLGADELALFLLGRHRFAEYSRRGVCAATAD